MTKRVKRSMKRKKSEEDIHFREIIGHRGGLWRED